MTRSDRSVLIGESVEGSDDRRIAAVLRVLRGDDRLAVARDLGVDIERLDEWIRVFLQAGREEILRRRKPLGATERLRTWAKIGQLTMRADLLERLLTRKGYAEELEALEREEGIDGRE